MTKKPFVLVLSILMLGAALPAMAQTATAAQDAPPAESPSAYSASKTMHELMSDEIASLQKTVGDLRDELSKAKAEAAKPRLRRLKLFYDTINGEYGVENSIVGLQNEVNSWFKANPGVTVISQELQVSNAGGVALAAHGNSTYSTEKEKEFRTIIVIAVFYEK